MTELSPAISIGLRPRRYPRELMISRRTLACCTLLLLLWIWPLTLQPEAVQIAIPVATDISIVTIFFFIIWRWNGSLPVFDIGVFFGVVSLLYAVVPSLNFISAGLTWTLLSDGRLQYYKPGPAEVARFTWPYTAILAGFCGAYLLFRWRRRLRHVPVAPPSRQVVLMILLVFVAAEAYVFGLAFIMGTPRDPSYLHGELEQFSVYFRMPLFLLQITHNIYEILFVSKVCLAAAILQRGKERWARTAFVFWLGAELVLVFERMGSRTWTALLLLVGIVLYHRMVKPLTLRIAIVGALAFIGAFIIQGSMRSHGGQLENVQALDRRIWTVNNDFQTMWASGYDVELRMKDPSFPRPPWQAYAIDTFMLIPSQLLPFEKIEPSTWYYTQIHATQSQMFGYRAQGVIGLGWIELLIRSIILGIIFAAVHRWYLAHVAGFWATTCYAYALVWSHYIYRSTMLWPLYFVVYDFLTVMIVIRVGAVLISNVARRPRTAIASP